jgi:hypothetical protein
MHAARILRDIAADGAGDLARGVRRVIEAEMAHRVGYGEVRHAGLRHHAAVRRVDLENAVEPAEAQQNAVGERQRTAGQRRAGAARHDLDPLVATEAQDRRDLFRRRRQHHHHRQLAISAEPVALEGAPFVGAVDDPLARQ